MSDDALSRRERQIMQIVYERGRCSAAEVLDAMPDPPGYSTVRTLLGILEEKGHLRHEEQGKRYVYLPTQPRQNAARSALKQVLQTFFQGSLEEAVATMLSDADTRISDDELARLAERIEQVQKEGR